MCDLERCPYCGLRLDDPFWLNRVELARSLLKVTYWPWRNHLNADELCQQAGLTPAQFEALTAARYAWPNKAGPRVSQSPKVEPVIDAWLEKNSSAKEKTL